MDNLALLLAAQRWVGGSPTKVGRNHGASRPLLFDSSALGSLMACSLALVPPLTATGIGTCDIYGISSISTMKLLEKNYERV